MLPTAILQNKYGYLACPALYWSVRAVFIIRTVGSNAAQACDAITHVQEHDLQRICIHSPLIGLSCSLHVLHHTPIVTIGLRERKQLIKHSSSDRKDFSAHLRSHVQIFYGVPLGFMGFKFCNYNLLASWQLTYFPSSSFIIQKSSIILPISFLYKHLFN